MLGQVRRLPDITYVQATAERLPFAPDSFNLLTVGLAFHLFDRTQFLAEARRVLEPGGWLVIYNNGFRAEMRENPSFDQWMRRDYGARYPEPPRHSSPLTSEDAETHGFRVLGRERYTNEVIFTPDELVNYLITHSNVIVAVEGGHGSEDDARAWLTASTAPLFPTPTGTFLFGGPIIFLQRHAT